MELPPLIHSAARRQPLGIPGGSAPFAARVEQRSGAETDVGINGGGVGKRTVNGIVGCWIRILDYLEYEMTS
ncbi:hypothetical protein L249_3245, partial [Ophiocordyceps polyrhachis-furcata BCC 54312]